MIEKDDKKVEEEPTQNVDGEKQNTETSQTEKQKDKDKASSSASTSEETRDKTFPFTPGNRTRLTNVKDSVVGDENLQIINSTIQFIQEKEASKEHFSEFVEEASFKLEQHHYPKDELDKINETFIASPSFVQLEDQIKNRLIILTGEGGAGKSTAALYLASIMRKKLSIKNIYILSDSLKITPGHLFNELPPQSFLIIENAFEDKSSFAIRLLGKGDRGWITHIKNLISESYVIIASNVGLPNFPSNVQRDLANAGILIEGFQRPDPIKILNKGCKFEFT